MDPIRGFLYGRNDVELYEAEAVKVDHQHHVIHIKDTSKVQGEPAGTSDGSGR
jgi:hypothetical protein